MSGHGTTSTAVKALKMGALDYLEKPLSYGQAVEAVNGGLRYPPLGGRRGRSADPARAGDRSARDRPPAGAAAALRPGRRGLRAAADDRPEHRALRARPALRPPHRHVAAAAAARSRHPLHHPADQLRASRRTSARSARRPTLRRSRADDGATISTVEHLLSALHAAGVTQPAGQGARRDPGARRLGAGVLPHPRGGRRRGPAGARARRWSSTAPTR